MCPSVAGLTVDDDLATHRAEQLPPAALVRLALALADGLGAVPVAVHQAGELLHPPAVERLAEVVPCPREKDELGCGHAELREGSTEGDAAQDSQGYDGCQDYQGSLEL